MLYLFDLDGTLISGYMDNPDKAYDFWVVLPGRRARLEALQNKGHSIAIVTNQGGVAMGYVTEQEWEAKLMKVARELRLLSVRSGGSPAKPIVFDCLHHEHGKPPYNHPREIARRKPAPTMIWEAISVYVSEARDGVVFIGDRPEDEQAAKNAGVSFVWADEFFKEEILNYERD